MVYLKLKVAHIVAPAESARDAQTGPATAIFVDDEQLAIHRLRPRRRMELDFGFRSDRLNRLLGRGVKGGELAAL
ncbi:hypothetical protein [Oceanomicrobium pacificus]|uniref:Uncharacterized protein n=1 Tax=Oceanomicrobium pacificus TaxID=2692916 RepID=A0A6B0TUF7_9RHOB|nr:hypothetical protein [Oceanomicrobium pacificus]MXU65415.1 hypothetical protein [Oceanomicrobium pacificus]